MSFELFALKEMLDFYLAIPKSACTENVLYKHATPLTIIRDDSCPLLHNNEEIKFKSIQIYKCTPCKILDGFFTTNGSMWISECKK